MTGLLTTDSMDVKVVLRECYEQLWPASLTTQMKQIYFFRGSKNNKTKQNKTKQNKTSFRNRYYEQPFITDTQICSLGNQPTKTV